MSSGQGFALRVVARWLVLVLVGEGVLPVRPGANTCREPANRKNESIDVRHLPELYYLQDQRDFPFQKAVVITATTIARWSKYYFTRLIAPKENIVAPFERSVGLSTDEQEIFISELIWWLFN